MSTREQSREEVTDKELTGLGVGSGSPKDRR